ncbi:MULTISPECIES: sarcosine oxidase subunit gamma [unclassified Nocardioides]|uniref:sarcosine oxidase subunit gamma n=1 Tax=unclassified Nocardioides TaxID=2615069 RepID=UPI0006FBF452|nr:MULTISPECIES: sarcosine oxidase subunit gamma family protein [unclassified Nocardioides]KRA37848.1 sarcosine oxidase subunit gamma [Nocardioides sp. Root614]KRA91808.1 sarcosine oxidase subunit gamma [Nocardioides sp. Root682]
MADLTTLQGLRRSPLQDMAAELRDGAVPGERSVALREEPFLTMVSIRVEPGSEAARGIEAVLGTGLPQQCGEVSAQGAHTVLWLGPDEWLVVSSTTPETLVGELLAGVGDGRAQVVDVSANRTVLELSGSAVRDVLEKGCPTDLHPRAFADGTAITTTLARVPVLLWKVDATRFRVLPRASLAQYVAAWLLDAVQEFAPAGPSAQAGA